MTGRTEIAAPRSQANGFKGVYYFSYFYFTGVCPPAREVLA